jgi:hypothetical protein
LETVAVALLTSLTFPPGALFDRLRRALYPDENLAATRKIGHIAATSSEAPWLDYPRSRQFGLTPAPTAPQFVLTIHDLNETARAFGPATSADAVHCAALVSMLNSL